MWTIKNRPRYNRDKLRYPSDLTEAEWAHIKPLIPPAKRGGGKRRVNMREVIRMSYPSVGLASRRAINPNLTLSPLLRLRILWRRGPLAL
jgi:hypothetical protein